MTKLQITQAVQTHRRRRFRCASLGSLLKSRGIAETGGQAKLMIQSGEVKLNGQVETRRRKKLVAGDRVEVHGKKYLIGVSLIRLDSSERCAARDGQLASLAPRR